MSTFNGSITANTDDGYTIDGGSWDVNNIAVGMEGGSFAQYDLFLRFDNVTIPYGATINSASITFTSGETDSGTNQARIYAINEDDTATFSSSPYGRSRTTENALWNVPARTNNSTYTTSDISSPVQAVINRVGWSSGNALGIAVMDTFYDTVIAQFYDYNNDSAKVATITIDYTVLGSPSPSLSASLSISRSPSLSPSPSSSISRSPSGSESPSTSPSPGIPFHGIKVAKPGKDAIATNNPAELIFDSDYGTLKYFTKQTLQATFDASSGDITGKATYTHNLGYYPFVEVYCSTNGGAYEYCPFSGSGASIQWSGNYKITTTDITVYGEVYGVSSSTWTFDFLIFIYKNDLQLS